MKFLKTLIWIFFISVELFAQHPDTLWTKTYIDGNKSETARQIIQTSDSNFVLAGSFMGSGLIKIDQDGREIWACPCSRTLSVVEMDDGNFMAVMYNSALSMTVGMISSQGEVIWDKDIPVDWHVYHAAIIKTASTDYVISCAVENETGSEQTCLFIKINDIGEIVWSYNYGGTWL